MAESQVQIGAFAALRGRENFLARSEAGLSSEHPAGEAENTCCAATIICASNSQIALIFL
jgi:hypothetical protein